MTSAGPQASTSSDENHGKHRIINRERRHLEHAARQTQTLQEENPPSGNATTEQYRRQDMQANYKRDRNIFHGSSSKFCCPGHDGLRKDHKEAANRRFRQSGKTVSRQTELPE